MSRNTTRSSFWPLVIGLAAIISMIAVFELAVRGGSLVSSIPSSPTAATLDATNTVATQITASPSSEATQDAIATIISLKSQDLTERVIALTAQFPTYTPVNPAGITDDIYGKAMWGKLGFVVQNGWGGVVDGNSVSVAAGAWSTAPGRGTLEILWLYPFRTINVEFKTPDQHGSVKITEEHDNRLTLVTTDGTMYYFDVPGLQFAPSLTEVIPTITPPPTYTPEGLATALPPTGYPISSATAPP